MPNNSTRALLQLSDVSYAINGKQILDDINVSVNSKEIVTIVGPNGAGKSTLLSIALGLKKPTSGQANQAPNLSIGFVPQSINREQTMPINVLDFLRLAKSSPSKKTIIELMDGLSQSKLNRTLLSDLSGGELRRVLFARALLNSPELLVLDEPTAGIDISGQEHFYSQLDGLREYYQFAILMVSHDLNLVMSTTDRVICLNKHICCQGKPLQVKDNPHYQKLFAGTESPVNSSTNLAFYEHKHNHRHEP